MSFRHISIDANGPKVWFTSDPHFGHRNVINLCKRPFNSLEHMHSALISNWNSVVAPEDTVIIVGDFSLSTKDAVAYGPALNGTKWLVPGNHDSVHSCKKLSPAKQAAALEAYKGAGFHVTEEALILNTVYGQFLVRHLPYLIDNDDDVRYKELRTVEPYNLICGHVHTTWTAKLHANGKIMVNVGVDANNFKPVSLGAVVANMKEIG